MREFFFDKKNPNIPPEIESQFLDNISNFENAFKNSKMTTVFEKTGQPEFKLLGTVSDSEIAIALDYIIELPQSFNIALDVL